MGGQQLSVAAAGERERERERGRGRMGQWPFGPIEVEKSPLDRLTWMLQLSPRYIDGYSPLTTLAVWAPGRIGQWPFGPIEAVKSPLGIDDDDDDDDGKVKKNNACPRG